MSKAPPPSDDPAPTISADMLSKVKNMAAPAGPAPSLPPSLLARASNRLKISREEVAGNDESFLSGADSPQDSPLKVDLGHDGDDDGNDNEGSSPDRDYARDDGYDYSRDDYDRRYDDSSGRSDRDDDSYYDRRKYSHRDNSYDDRDNDSDRGSGRDYDSRDDEEHNRYRDRDRDTRIRYYSDEDGGPRRSGAGSGQEARAAQPKSTIDLKRADPYTYTSTSRIPVITEKAIVFNFRPILKATYRELRNFVLSPVQPGHVVRCYIGEK